MATPIFSPATNAPASAVADQARGIARMLREGFDHHYAVFRECARAAKRHFEAGNWLAIQHVARDRIDFYDRRVLETAANIERQYDFAGLDDAGGEALWEQVKLHYIGLLIDHKQPECAETFFNSVSVQDAAPRVLPQPLHLRAPDDLHRAHRRRSAVVPQLLPAAAGPAPRADRHRARLPVRAPVRGFRRRSAPRARGVPPARSAAVPPRVQPPDPGPVVAVLPQPDRVHRRARRQRRPGLPVRRADQARCRREALLRRAHHGRSRPRDPVLGEPRVFPGRHGSAVRVRRLPARDPAGQDRRGALHDGRAAEGGQEPLLPRLPAPSQALARQVRHRAGHQGSRDDRVHAAVVSVRVQGDPRQDRRIEGHRPAEGQAEVLARQAPRPRRTHDRHPRVFGRRVPARAFLRRAHRRARRRRAVGARVRARPRRRQAPLHRAPDDSAQSLSRARGRTRSACTRCANTATR